MPPGYENFIIFIITNKKSQCNLGDATEYCIPRGVIWFAYSGPKTTTNMNNTCSIWKHIYSKVDRSNRSEKIIKPWDDNKCRNPDADPYGPWCFSKNERGSKVKKITLFQKMPVSRR